MAWSNGPRRPTGASRPAPRRAPGRRNDSQGSSSSPGSARRDAARSARKKRSPQERGALPERTARLMGLRADVGTDADLVGFEGCPVDVAGVMIHDQDRPPVVSDATLSDAGSTRFVNDTLVLTCAHRHRRQRRKDA